MYYRKMRGAALLLGAAMALTMVTACGESPAASTESPPEKTDVSQSDASELTMDEGNVNIWAFAEPHANYFKWVTAEYTKLHPEVTFDIQMMDTTAMNDRLTVIVTAGGEGAPDLVDVEQGQFPRYMNEERMCFEPLTDRMRADGVLDKMVESRLSLYQYKDNYYGLEHALCPTTMAYRPDLFEKAGAEVPKTWDEYMAAAEKLQEQGIYIAAASDLVSGNSGEAEMYLREAGNDIVKPDGSTNIAGNADLKKLMDDMLYLQKNDMVLPIEADADRWNAIARDEVATYYTPDWAAGWLRDNVPEQAGQWKMTYLPRFNDQAARTAPNGGTGLSMCKFTKKDKDTLWDFMKFAMVNTDNVVKKYEMINLYPPVYDAMPLCNGPVEYYDNQVLGELYTEIAAEMPTQNQAGWRSRFGESLKSYSYDWVEGNLTTDEMLKKIQDDVDAYIAEQK